MFRLPIELRCFVLMCALSTAGGAETSDEMGTSSDAGGRIVGGSDVTSLGTLPWQGLLRTSNSSQCGCSLLAAQYALTAAHCTDGWSASQLTLYFGILDISDVTQAQQTISVTAIYQHSDYDIATHRWDISLLQLASSATLDANVAAIALPTQGGAVADGTSCIISGWGTLSHGGASPTVLQQATVPIASQSQCQTDLSGHITLHSEHVCAGHAAGGADTCQGDGGGPLACYDSATSRYVLHGIVTSHVVGCGNSSTPSVYTRVSELVNWIDANMPNTIGSVAASSASPNTGIQLSLLLFSNILLITCFYN